MKNWYEHVPEGAVDNEEAKVLSDISVKYDTITEARRLDIIVIDKKKRKELIIDIAIPADVRVREIEWEKVEKYQDFKREIERLWRIKIIEVVSALGSVTKEFYGWIEKPRITNRVGVMQETALLGTATILRRRLEM